MKLLKPFQILYVVYALLLFLVLMIPVFLWSVIASFFGRIKGGNLIYRACMLWGDIWFALLFIRHKNIHETAFNKNRSYIFVANHISYFDTPALVKTFRQPVRPLGKIEMTKIPIFGFIYKRAIVTVDRTSAQNRANSVLLLKSILGKGISILVFPEGTFNLTAKPLKSFYDGAFKIAIETKTPIKPVLFLDTYRRMHYSSIFTLNPGINRSVFLKEIETADLTINDLAALKEKVYKLMESKLRDYNAPWIKD
jgi:1-acyl-sn-glycerol-3-phosphate acyltransferase